MNQTRTKLTTIITFLLTLAFTSCSSSSASIPEKKLTAVSNEKVTISTSNADAYSWEQESGIEVILVGANTKTLSPLRFNNFVSLEDGMIKTIDYYKNET